MLNCENENLILEPPRRGSDDPFTAIRGYPAMDQVASCTQNKRTLPTTIC